MLNVVLFLAYTATIPLANFMIASVGTCIPKGPCLVPVGFGLSAPSGVLLIGVALVLRDAIHQRLGAFAALSAITVGCFVSYLFSAPALVVASVAAFALSEIADLLVYAPLRRRRLVLAVLLSGAAGAAVDSAVFLWLAFGSLDYLAGQIVGKMWATIGAVAVLLFMRGRVST